MSAKTEMAPMAPTLGNTKARVSASKRWCFTWFADEINLDQMAPCFEGWLFVIGLEICPTTGKKHVQGYIEFDKKIRPLENKVIKEILPNAHWEKAIGSKEENYNYCTKEKNYRTNIKLPRPLLDPLEGIKLYPWQKEILEIINKPCLDKRSIYWIWESNGKTGKTTLAKHICMNYNAIYVQGKTSDIKFAVAKHLEIKKEVDVCIFAFPRSYEDYVSYDAIESIKDGIYFNGKYESNMCIFNSPHVFIFANFEPDTEKLSHDRWKVKEIKI